MGPSRDSWRAAAENVYGADVSTSVSLYRCFHSLLSGGMGSNFLPQILLVAVTEGSDMGLFLLPPTEKSLFFYYHS